MHNPKTQLQKLPRKHRGHRECVTGEAKITPSEILTCAKSPGPGEAYNEGLMKGLFRKSIAKEIERAVACGGTRKLYHMLKRVNQRSAEVGVVLLERNRRGIPYIARSLCRWGEHPRELPNHAAPLNTTLSPVEQYPCEVNPLPLDEVCTAIRLLHNNKAPCDNDFSVKIYKTCLDNIELSAKCVQAKLSELLK